jgi:DNA-binding response OmpR family regulator
LNILLIDDDEFFVKVVATQLNDEYKHSTTVARSGQESMKLLQNGSNIFDVILMDYDMPEVNGLDLLKWMNDRHIETPVVMLTAAGSEAVAVEAMKLGAYDYVRKEHLDVQHLGIVIDATLERRQFRIAKVVEEQRAREVGLNKLATDKVRDILNAITPLLSTALGNIHGDIEMKGEEICHALPESSQCELRKLFLHLQKEAISLETSIRGLLGLYRLLYAHYVDVQEIERLKQEIEARDSSL